VTVTATVDNEQQTEKGRDEERIEKRGKSVWYVKVAELNEKLKAAKGASSAMPYCHFFWQMLYKLLANFKYNCCH